jgi:uncharacterized damage-inducible protein DinB
MDMIPMFLTEMEQEAQTTRNMLALVPDDRFGWQPHPKSMTMRELATHIAEIPSWFTMTLTTDELDFATTPYTPTAIANNAELMAFFETNLADGRAHLIAAREEQMTDIWTMRNGDDIYSRLPKSQALRESFCQIVHHRAQLGVYLRLLDIPIPGSYGPSADDNSF